MSDTPDYVPLLRKGVGATPQDGGCIVQIANWLSDNNLWTDNPICVQPELATWAITVNDLVCDNTRRKMALLAPRLTGTRIGDKFQCADIGIALLNWARDNPMPLYSKLCGPAMKAGEMAAWFEYGLVNDEKALAWLIRAIDEYDRIVGRHPAPLLTEEQGRRLCEVMGQ